MISVNNVQALDKIYIMNNTSFDLGNGANITLASGQVFDDHIDLQPGGNPIIHLYLNESQMNFTSISDKNISNFVYNYSADKIEFDVIGTSDLLGMNAKMRRANTWYNESDALVVIMENKSDPEKQVAFIFNDWVVNQHHITIEANISGVTLYSVSGYIKNKLNESLYNVNVAIIGDGYTNSDINGYYIMSNLESGNYTIKAVLYPYSNKIVNFQINDADLINLNITMQVQSGGGGGVGYKEDYTPLYALIFLIVIVIVFVIKKRKNKDEDDEEQ
jgi:hypothetical protein